MKIGASSFIWVSPFSNESLYLAAKVQAMGFDILEVCIEDPQRIDIARTREALDQFKLGVTICGAFGPSRDASSEDATIRRQAAEYIKACVKISKGVGSEVVAGPMYSAVGKTRLLDAAGRNKQWGMAVETLKGAADNAGEEGIKLAIEPLNRFETDLINTVEQGLDLISRIDRPNVGLLLDTFHMNIEEKDWAAAIRQAGSKIFHFHASENDRGTPGKGLINWVAVRNALRQAGYQGPGIIESFTTDIKEIARAVSLWRPVAPDQDSLARDGLYFLKKLFAESS